MSDDRIKIVGAYLLANGRFQLTYNSRGKDRPLICADRNSAATAQEILKGHVYDLASVEPVLEPGAKIVLDIGANMGAFAVLVSHTWPGSRVFAFEPGNDAFGCLSQNVAFFPDLRVFQFGLGHGDHRVTAAPPANGSIGLSVGSLHGDGAPPIAGGEAIEIRDSSRTLTELGIADIDIIKIDTEGSEVPIVAGLGSRVNTAKIVYLEYHSDEDRRILDGLLSPTHLIFAGRAIAPHRGELCYIRRDLSAPWDGTRIVLPRELA